MQDRMGGFKGRVEISQHNSLAPGNIQKRVLLGNSHSHFLSPLPIGYLALLFLPFFF